MHHDSAVATELAARPVPAALVMSMQQNRSTRAAEQKRGQPARCSFSHYRAGGTGLRLERRVPIKQSAHREIARSVTPAAITGGLRLWTSPRLSPARGTIPDPGLQAACLDRPRIDPSAQGNMEATSRPSRHSAEGANFGRYIAAGLRKCSIA